MSGARFAVTVKNKGAASGGTGIIPALSESFTRAMSEAPGVFATCLQNQATTEAGRIELRVLMS